MEQYKINIELDQTLIQQFQYGFSLRIQKQGFQSVIPPAAVVEGTLYKEKGGFIPDQSYFFEVLFNKEMDINNVILDDIMNAIDFFFLSILDSEYYIKKIPQTSSLFPLYARGLNFSEPIELKKAS